MKLETRYIYDHEETKVIDQDIKLILEGDPVTVMLLYGMIDQKLLNEGWEEIE
jgi:hypothetical protein